MSVPSIVIFASLLACAFLALIGDLRPQGEPVTYTALDRFLWRFFGFFGIGDVPPMLVLAVFASTAAIAGGTLDIIAGMHLGTDYPSWFPANAGASGMGVGLLCARVLAATEPIVEPVIEPPGQHMAGIKGRF